MWPDGGPRGPRSEECKGNYAVYVKEIMPDLVECGAGEPVTMMINMRVFSYFAEMSPHFPVDILIVMYIMDLTSSVGHLGGHFGDPQTLASQTRSFTQTRLPQSEARVGRRRTVRCHRLLRSVRPAAGEVRDGAARARRQTASQRHRPQLWVFTPNCLSGSLRVRSKYPPAKPGALVVSRSKRPVDAAAARPLEPPIGGCLNSSAVAPAGDPPVLAVGCSHESPPRLDQPSIRSNLAPRNAGRRSSFCGRQTPARCGSRSCP